MSVIPGVPYLLRAGDWVAPGRPTLPGRPPKTSPVADAGAALIGSAIYTPPNAALYVAPTGSDTAPGTLAQPLATLGAALSRVSAGGTIVMRQGVHRVGQDTQNSQLPAGHLVTPAGVSVQNYPGEIVWLDGSEAFAAGAWTAQDGAWWAPYDRVFNRSPSFVNGADDDPRIDGWAWVDPAYPQACWPDMIFVDGVQQEQVTSKAAVTAGKFFVEGAMTGTGKWFAATKVWIGTNPAGKAVRYAARTKVLTVKGAGFTLRGVGIRRFATTMPSFGALYVEGADFTAEHCHLEDMAAFAIHADTYSDRLTLRRNTIRRISNTALQTNGSYDLLVEDNIFDDTCRGGWNWDAPGSGAIKVTRHQRATADRGTIRRNIMRNGKHGVWTDMSVYGLRVYSNLLQDNTRDGIQYELSGGCDVFDNLILNTGRTPLYVHNTNRARVYNNTVIGCGTEYMPLPNMANARRKVVQFIQDFRRDPASTGYGSDPRQPASFYDNAANKWLIQDVEYFNNVIAGIGSGVYSGLAIDDLERNTGGGRLLAAFGIKSGGNVYSWATNPTYPYFTPDITTKGSGVQVFYSLGVLQASTPLEKASTFSASSPLTASKTLSNQSTADVGAQGLPADIAALLGKTAGTKRIGCFWADAPLPPTPTNPPDPA